MRDYKVTVTYLVEAPNDRIAASLVIDGLAGDPDSVEVALIDDPDVAGT